MEVIEFRKVQENQDENKESRIFKSLKFNFDMIHTTNFNVESIIFYRLKARNRKHKNILKLGHNK